MPNNIDWTKAGLLAGGGGLAGWLFNKYLLGNKSIQSDIIASLIGASLTGGGSVAYDYFTDPKIGKTEKEWARRDKEIAAAKELDRGEKGESGETLLSKAPDYIPGVRLFRGTDRFSVLNPESPTANAVVGGVEGALIPVLAGEGVRRWGIQRPDSVNGVTIKHRGNIFGRSSVLDGKDFSKLSDAEKIDIGRKVYKGMAGPVKLSDSQLTDVADAVVRTATKNVNARASDRNIRQLANMINKNKPRMRNRWGAGLEALGIVLGAADAGLSWWRASDRNQDRVEAIKKKWSKEYNK